MLIAFKTVIPIFSIIFMQACTGVPPQNYPQQISKAVLTPEQHTETLNGILRMSTGIIDALSSQHGKKISDEQLQKIEKQISATFSYEYFTQKNSAAIAHSFTSDELKQIWSFYNTPTGKKWLEYMPKMVNQTMSQVVKELDEKIPALVAASTKPDQVQG